MYLPEVAPKNFTSCPASLTPTFIASENLNKSSSSIHVITPSLVSPSNVNTMSVPAVPTPNVGARNAAAI